MKNGKANQHVQFPCKFPIKIVARSNKEFEKIARSIIIKHFPDFDNTQYRRRLSRDANFLSLTVVVNAHNQAELDAVYAELSICNHVIMAL